MELRSEDEPSYSKQDVASERLVGQTVVVASDDDSVSGGAAANVYETIESLHMYLGLHYPESGVQDGVPAIIGHSNAPTNCLRFPQRVAELLISLMMKQPGGSSMMGAALDVGSAVGGGSFELAKSFDKVDAFDFSHTFVDAAKRIQSGKEERFKIPIEADIYQEVSVHHDVSSDTMKKVSFFQGDACKIGEMAAAGLLHKYDGIIMSNLLCRLPDPLACLNGLSDIVNEGGVVVLVTPYSWLEEFTPRNRWLGGSYDPISKEPLRSKDALHLLMEERGFEKIHEEEMALVIREHQRKYQYIVSEATGWRKM